MMMMINHTCQIKGSNKKEIEILLNAYNFYLQTLMPRKRKPIDTDIIIEDIGDDRKGDIYPEDDYYQMRLHKSLSLRGKLITLAHECVHIRQYERKNLIDINYQTVKWYSQIYSPDTPTHKCPWEIEAIGLGQCLFEMFVHQEKIYTKDSDYK